jgi:hypothetical protein
MYTILVLKERDVTYHVDALFNKEDYLEYEMQKE